MPNATPDNLMAAPRQAPRQTVDGVVHPFGVGASHLRGDEFWRLSFALAAWLVADGSVRPDMLSVGRHIQEDEPEVYRAQLPKDGIVTLEVGLEEMRQPVIRQDTQLGTFTLDRRLGRYEAQTSWRTSPMRLTLGAGESLGDETFPRQSLARPRLCGATMRGGSAESKAARSAGRSTRGTATGAGRTKPSSARRSSCVE